MQKALTMHFSNKFHQWAHQPFAIRKPFTKNTAVSTVNECRHEIPHTEKPPTVFLYTGNWFGSINIQFRQFQTEKISPPCLTWTNKGIVNTLVEIRQFVLLHHNCPTFSRIQPHLISLVINKFTCMVKLLRQSAEPRLQPTVFGIDYELIRRHLCLGLLASGHQPLAKLHNF